MDPGASDRLTLQVAWAPTQRRTRMAKEVYQGLIATPKYLPSKYFYDDRGCELFEQITELPEYYQTRTEFGILKSIAGGLAAEFGFNELVEIGSGSSTKTRTLLDALDQEGRLARYVPLDISERALRESSLALLRDYPRLRVHGVVGDFLIHLDRVPESLGRRLVIFLGSTIGNLDADERRPFLERVRALLAPGDCFLLGLDLVKDVGRLEAAYNDSAGVTAEFNRNILRAINRDLSGNFNLAAFRHYSFYNLDQDRIEMHLVPDVEQRVWLDVLPLKVTVAPGETIRSEISCKFTRDTAQAMLEETKLELERWYTDAEGLFGLALATLG